MGDLGAQIRAMYRHVWEGWREAYEAAPDKAAFMAENESAMRLIETQMALAGDHIGSRTLIGGALK